MCCCRYVAAGASGHASGAVTTTDQKLMVWHCLAFAKHQQVLLGGQFHKLGCQAELLLE